MTIIAAASWGRAAAIGSDQAGSDGWGLQTVFGSKLAVFPFGVVGFSGSYRTLQAIAPRLFQVQSCEDHEGALALVRVIDESLKEAGWSRSRAEGLPKCEDLAFLVLSGGGKIFAVQSDLSVLQPARYYAIGSGYQVATGALFATDGRISAKRAVQTALEASVSHLTTCAGVGPIVTRRVAR